MVDVSSLVIRVDSKEVKVAGAELQKFAKSGGKADNQTKKLGRTSDKLKSSFIGLRGAAASLGAAMAFRQVVKAADTFQLLNARIALVSDTTKEAEKTYGDLLAMSQRTGSALESSITLYTRMARATDNLGLSNRQLLTVTESIANSMRISGATSAEASSSMIQLSQAMNAGFLSGQEFNSMADAAPRLLRAIMDSTGWLKEDLKELGSQGKITSSIMVKAFLDQSQTLKKEASTLPDTVGKAMTQLANDATDAFGRADVSPLVDAIGELRDIVTNDGFQTSMINLASGIAKLTAAMASSTSEGVKFVTWLSEELAAGFNGFAFDNVTRVEREIYSLEQLLKGIKNDKIVFFREFQIEGYTKEINKLKNKLKDFKDFEDDLFKPDSGADGDKPIKGDSGSGGGGTGKPAKLTSIERQVKALEMEAAALGKKRAEIMRMTDAYKKATPAQQASIDASLAAIKAFEEESAASDKRIKDAADKAADEKAKADQGAEDLQGLIDSLMTEEDAIRASYERRVQIVLDNTKDGSAQEIKLLKQLDAEKKAALDELNNDDNDLAKDFAKLAKDNIQTSISDAIINGVNDGGKGALEAFGDLMLKMAAEAVAADIMNGIFNGGGMAGGIGGGDNTAGLVSGIGSLFAGFFDQGGNIPSGQFGIAGENGPEIIQGPANVTSTKDTAAAMSSGPTIGNINMSFPGIGNANEARIAAGQAAREINGIVGSSKRFA